MKSFDLSAFKSMLQGTRQQASVALSTGMQGVATANREIKKVETQGAKKAPRAPGTLSATQVEAKLHRDQAAYDATHKELQRAQKAMNLRSLATLQHHQLEKALEMHMKGKETDADYSRNIAWDKKDMATTKTMEAKVGQLSKQAAAEQKQLNADIASMLSLEQANTKKRMAAQQHAHAAAAPAATKQRALAHLASKAAAAPHPSAPKAAALPSAAAAMKQAATAALSSAAPRTGAGGAHPQAQQQVVPPACLDLSVVKGAVHVPKHCLQYKMVKQVIGEAKRRGGVKFVVAP